MQNHQQPLWRTLQRQNFTDWDKLASFLEWDPFVPPQTSKHFPLNLPRRLAEKIQKNNMQDPILLQFLPSVQETVQYHGTPCHDPVGDLKAQKTTRLLHKYEGRALLICTGACAMHCRFCFRQHYDYPTMQEGFEEELELIAKDPSLSEIILSGGDPLSLSNQILGRLIERLAAISHVKRIRFHTRFPIGIPERIDSEFLDILSSSTLQFVFIIHSNHPNEWDADITFALKQVQKLGIPLLSQTVLLKGINDNVKTLKALCEKLVDQGIIPYYLHQLDRAAGTLHFEVSKAVGLQLIQQLGQQISGYGVPRYVQEIAGEGSKISLHPI